MSRIGTIVRAVLPSKVKRVARSIHRKVVFRSALRKFLNSPEADLLGDSSIFAELIYGWGNESWSAQHEYLAECIRHAAKADGPILECGSGLSTLLIGIIAKRRGLRHIALEHSADWAAKLQSHLNKYSIDSVALLQSPLKNYGEFSWYDVPSGSMPAEFSLVICDGPPGATKGGRFGLVPVMRDKLGPGCVILLDDAARSHEMEIAHRWEPELQTSIEVLGDSKPYAKMVVGSLAA